MTTDLNRFASAYESTPPWDIGKPQPAFVEAADHVQGRILDVGCGTGENAIFFAERGHQVTGVDYVAAAVKQAQLKAAQRNVNAVFTTGDARDLHAINSTFESVLDCGLFHIFDDDDRTRYVDSLKAVTKPGGRLFLLCFSDEEPLGEGPRRVTQDELRQAFRDGWEVESIEAARLNVTPPYDGTTFTAGGPKAWFMIARRR